MSNGNYDFEGHAIPKKVFHKKLKHGDNYCTVHDEMKHTGTKWDSVPMDNKPIVVMVCSSCIIESMEELER